MQLDRPDRDKAKEPIETIDPTADRKVNRQSISYWQGQYIVAANKTAGYAQGLIQWLENEDNAVTEAMATSFREVADIWARAAEVSSQRLNQQDRPRQAPAGALLN